MPSSRPGTTLPCRGASAARSRDEVPVRSPHTSAAGKAHGKRVGGFTQGLRVAAQASRFGSTKRQRSSAESVGTGGDEVPVRFGGVCAVCHGWCGIRCCPLSRWTVTP